MTKLNIKVVDAHNVAIPNSKVDLIYKGSVVNKNTICVGDRKTLTTNENGEISVDVLPNDYKLEVKSGYSASEYKVSVKDTDVDPISIELVNKS